MDKNNKNRSDLLAAGRKKLQQFRQKKDGKSGKSSGKSNKPECETEKVDATSECVVDEEILVPEDVDHSCSQNPEAIISEHKSGLSDMPLITKDLSEVERWNREEQVPDIGTMQEVGSSCSKYADVSSKIGNERVFTDESSREMKGETRETSNNAAEADDMCMDSVPICPSPESGGTALVVTAHLPGGQINVASGSSSDIGQVDMADEKAGQEGSSECTVDGSLSFLGSYMLTLSSGSDACLVSLSQLADVIQRLDEDKFSFLFGSSNAPIEKLPNIQSLNACESANFDIFERLKDQLYLTSFARDTSQLQLAEQLELEMLLLQQIQKLVDEMTLTSASLEDVRRRNEILSEELAECRSELWDVVSGRDKLQKQLHDSEAGVDEFSARVNELQNKLEISEGNLASLGSELVDCRSISVALQAENEAFNERLILVREEKMKLAEEREYFVQENEKMATELAWYKSSLASLQLENVNLSENLSFMKEKDRQLNEENELLVHEKNKLLLDFADCKAMVEALQDEITNLKEVLAAVEEENKKLEENKKYFVPENEKLAADLINSRGSVEALCMEMSNMNGSHSPLTEERNKLEEEKQYLLTKSRSQSHEVEESKVIIAGLQAEMSKAVEDLKEASLQIEQLTVENVFLGTNLELHMDEISTYKGATHQIEDSGDRGLIQSSCGSLSFGPGESETTTPIPEENSSESIAVRSIIVQDDSHDSSRFEIWKRQLEEANKIFQKLEKAIEALHSYSASLSRSSAKPLASGVSKLVQAFESKGQTDEHELANLPSSDNLMTGDPYKQTTAQMEQLKKVIKHLFYEAENASKYVEQERKGRVSAEVTGAELKDCCESLVNQRNYLEEENIELIVLCEVLKQHIRNSTARLAELVLLYEEKQECVLDAENHQLIEKMGSFYSKITEYENLLDAICRNSDQMVSSVSNQVENLRKEVGERGSILEEEWNSFLAQIVQAIGKLEESIDPLCTFNSSTGLHNCIEVGMRIVASIDVATRVIDALREQLKAAQIELQVSLKTYTELETEFNSLLEKNGRAFGLLNKIYCDLRHFVPGSQGYAEGTSTGRETQELQDLLNSGAFDVLMQQLGNLLDEKVQLESINNKLNSDLMDLLREIDEVKRQCLDSDYIVSLLRDAEPIFKVDSFDIHTSEPLSCVKSFINFLIQKYKEAEEQIILSMAESASNKMHISGLQGQMKHLSYLIVQLDIENVVFKESWRMINEDIPFFRTELLEKVAELEQSEQRVLALREKLSIAVTKGKGLVVQRDSLKQSLAETSSQLEKCSQELQSKDVRIHELESKIKNYSEAGERMEALESELSYIRNSATALRESFLLKDSVLQRIEEILEDLELPEHFHSGGIIEKINWLAKSATGNTLPLLEWDQNSSVGGASYSDGRFAVMDGWKEETQPSQSLVEDLRRRYEELQRKFFGLAEQNEMLEQSLMERNNLVQQWEHSFAKIDVPSQLRSLEPEDRIQWLGSALSSAQDHCNSFQQRIDQLDASCRSLSGDLEESHNRVSELELAYQSIIVEKEFLLKSLETLNYHCDEKSKKAFHLESRNQNLLKEVSSLQEKVDQNLVNEAHIHHVECQVKRLQDLIWDALQNYGADDAEFDSNSIECLEQLLRKLIEKYRTLLQGNATDIHAGEGVGLTGCEERIKDSGDVEEDPSALREKLGDTLGELTKLREERDRLKENNQSLACQLEAFDIKKKELQELLNLEEQKSASLREKLNIAVKKGKSLVQQRDNFKQIIEEVNAEVDRLKSEISLRENSIAEYECRIRNFSVNQERIQGLESESQFLRDRLAETEQYMQEKDHLLSITFNSLRAFNVDVDFNLKNPVEQLEALGKHWRGLQAALDFSEQESRRSKRAAELLLAELNEVQERNDGLQEDLAKIASELSEISTEKELSEAAKAEALVQLEKLAAVRTEEKDHLSAEVMMLKSNVDQIREELSLIDNIVADVLSNDSAILNHLEASITSCLAPANAPSVAVQLAVGTSGGIAFNESENKIFMPEIDSLKEKLLRHYNLLCEKDSRISDVVKTIHSEIASLKHASGARENDLMQLEAIVKAKDSELSVVHQNISLLYKVCNIAALQIENLKAQRVGMGTETRGVDLKSQILVDEGITHLYSEEDLRTVKEKLLSVVKDMLSVQNNIIEDSLKEMKTTIMKLQKELHEKDIQKDRISMEFVSQIKEAEAVAKNYLQGLQLEKTRADDLQSQLIVIERERTTLQGRIKQLEDQETTFTYLEQKVASMADSLAAKEQEAEALMQALDEEESQMEDMSNKIGELEKSLRQKNEDLDNLGASRKKALRKLSGTVNKFDELHHLSESLLSEVESLQSQLQERDGEISFLRQEVTRCTNEALAASQMSHKKNSNEIHNLLTWLDMVISRVHKHDMHVDDTENQLHGCKHLLEKQITSIVSELEELRVAVQNKDALLQAERRRVEELIQKQEFLENSLHDQESHLTMLKHVDDAGQASSTGSEIVEVEPVINKWAASGTIAPQVRGGRKTNSDQVAIAIDMDNNRMEDEDDDKAHGFKSLTMSRIVPRFTRPVSDMIDGLWVSCDRALMRQPALRLGVIVYWAILHALLAAFVV